MAEERASPPPFILHFYPQQGHPSSTPTVKFVSPSQTSLLWPLRVSGEDYFVLSFPSTFVYVQKRSNQVGWKGHKAQFCQIPYLDG